MKTTRLLMGIIAMVLSANMVHAQFNPTVFQPQTFQPQTTDYSRLERSL